MKFVPFGTKDRLPITITGKPDRLSQTLFGNYGLEKRWDALDAIAEPDQPRWHQRLLLWMLAIDELELRERAWEILNQLNLDFDLLVEELSSPMWQVRVGAIRLLAKTGRLETIRLFISCLEDYHERVVEAVKDNFLVLINHARKRLEAGQLSDDEIESAIDAMFKPLYKSRRTGQLIAIQYLFELARLNEVIFWQHYAHLGLQQFTLIHNELIRQQKDGVLDLAYRGLLITDEIGLEHLSGFLVQSVRNSGSQINYHLHALRDMKREEFVRIAFALQHHRILVEMQGLIKFMSPPERIVLFDLLEAVGAEQNLAFLLRCLQLDDSRIRIRVLKILGESESLPLRNEVYEFLTETDEQVLLATLRYLQKKGDLSILEKIAHLTRSKKKKIKQGVLGTMFKIMKDDLLRKFDRLPTNKRNKIVQSLMKMKPDFFDEMAYLSDSADINDRIKYIKLLDVEELNHALVEYYRLTQDENSKVRATAVKGFQRLEDIETRFQYVKAFFSDPDPRVRSNAIELLPDEKPDNPEMIQAARKSARSENSREKCTAISKLLNWKFYEYKIELISLLESDDEWRKSSALWVLGVTHQPDLIDHLRESANDPRAPVREMAVRGIGLKGNDEDLRALMPFLRDPELKVRRAAQEALRKRLNLSFEIAN